MNRHFEYIDADGKHWSGVQEVPHLPREPMDTIIRHGNRLLAILARARGWKPFPGEIQDGHPVYIHTWHPDFPLSERMKRTNLVQKKNGQPELYDASAIEVADKPGVDITIAHFDQDGNVLPSMVIPPLGRSQILPPPIINGIEAATKTIVIQDQGTAATSGEPSVTPASVTMPAPAPSAGTMPAPAPIETRE